ncbi:MAG: hypothetical protein U0Y68_15665 [Blastocatellia bacterium]
MNNLNLAVADPNGKIYYGNDFGSTGKFDEVNNVEGIVAESVLGQWRVKNVPRELSKPKILLLYCQEAA